MPEEDNLEGIQGITAVTSTNGPLSTNFHLDKALNEEEDELERRQDTQIR